MKRVTCHTLFDITRTGVTSHLKSTAMPFQDQSGTVIQSAAEWNRARNQQRNLETIIQLLSLRTQPFNVTQPRSESLDLSHRDFGSNHTGTHQVWSFSFEIEHAEIFQVGNNDLALLAQDAETVPMLTGLSETAVLDPWCKTQGQDCNLYFVDDK
jgi:hypothetical protein